jgi:hypothetical protein
MSLKGWFDTLDKFAPRCPQCARKMRNQMKCPACGQVTCSHNCHQRHVKSAHPLLVEEQKQAIKDHQQATKNLANLQRQEEQRKAMLDIVLAKKKNLEQLRVKIEKATTLHNERLHAWQQAGSPDVQQADVDRAKEDASTCRALLKQANKGRSMTSFKIGYLKLALFTRRMAAQLRMGWFVPGLIGGTVFFTFTSIIALLLTGSALPTFVLGGIGFFGGFLAILNLLYVPDDNEARMILASLGQQESDQVEPQEAAELTYKEAQQRYDNLARLLKLRTEYERALLDKQQLEREYQAACDD